jgi:hypothetical protein
MNFGFLKINVMHAEECTQSVSECTSRCAELCFIGFAFGMGCFVLPGKIQSSTAMTSSDMGFFKLKPSCYHRVAITKFSSAFCFSFLAGHVSTASLQNCLEKFTKELQRNMLVCSGVFPCLRQDLSSIDFAEVRIHQLRMPTSSSLLVNTDYYPGPRGKGGQLFFPLYCYLM